MSVVGGGRLARRGSLPISDPQGLCTGQVGAGERYLVRRPPPARLLWGLESTLTCQGSSPAPTSLDCTPPCTSPPTLTPRASASLTGSPGP